MKIPAQPGKGLTQADGSSTLDQPWFMSKLYGVATYGSSVLRRRGVLSKNFG